MTKLTRDPQLDQLVRELNDGGAAPVVQTERVATSKPLVSWPAADVDSGHPLESILMQMTQHKASDLILLAGSPPVLRVAGRLVRVDAAALEQNDVQSMVGHLVTERIRDLIEQNGAADLSVRLSRGGDDDDRRASRFRVNLHRQRGSLAAAIRALPNEIPTLQQLNLPATLAELMKPKRGLVLVCGPTGSGKSTTLAALLGEINRNEQRHIITIEDPIEYEHRNGQSVVEQIEIGRDAPTFAAALRASLRQNPDVILVGEMRDLETVATALTAAETGHLILSTLHTSDAASAVHRIIDVFPPAQQTQIKQQLALSLNAIVCQQLIARQDNGGRAVAAEVLLANHAVRNHIRNDKLQNIITEITLGKRGGMISMEDSLAKLVQQGLITVDEARARSSRPEELDSLLKR